MFMPFGQRASSLRNEENGQISIIVALALIPVLTIAGLAIDFQRTTVYKNKVQYAMDAALIAGSKAKQTGASNQEIETLIEDYLEAVLLASSDSSSYCEEADVNVPEGSEDITATVDCSYPTTLSNAIGRSHFDFQVSSTSTYGIGDLDVAFVFDVSGSMDGSRMTDLRAAAKKAVDTLLPEDYNPENGQTRIAMTAYSNMVDAGPFFEAVTGAPPERSYSATYTEVKEVQTTCKKWKKRKRRGKRVCDEWNYEEVETEYESTYEINDTCIHERDGEHAFNDAPPAASQSYTYVRPAFTDEDGDVVPSETITESDNTFLTERQPIWDEDENEWKAPELSCTDHPPLTLTDDVTALKAYIDALDPDGWTAGHQGTMWGWYLISPEWGDVWASVDGEGARPWAYNRADTSKALIMMTDGTFNERYHEDQGSSAEQALATCATARANGIVIYTVAFQAPDDAKITLRNCSSGDGYWHEPNSADELDDAYQEIATSISDLRIKF